MTKKLNSERVDAANPEWSAKDFANAKPASEALAGLFGKAQAKEMLNPKRGWPKAAATKEHVNVRFDSGGRGAMEQPTDLRWWRPGVRQELHRCCLSERGSFNGRPAVDCLTPVNTPD